jgi:hypothetical protein
VYSNLPGSVIPLRLAQAREAIFPTRNAVGPYTSIRTATGYLNGVEQSCVLTGFAIGGHVFTGARNWDESERCVDSNTGLLTTYSPVPGLYVHYDYANAVKCHGKIIPAGFTITVAGRTVIEAKTQDVTDPPDAKSVLFSPAGLTALGVGRLMSPARAGARVSLIPPSRSNASNTNAAIQVVVLHGSVSPDGRLSETEILASTDTSLNQTALDRAIELHNRPIPNGAQPGVTPQSHEILFTFRFVTSAQ